MSTNNLRSRLLVRKWLLQGDRLDGHNGFVDSWGETKRGTIESQSLGKPTPTIDATRPRKKMRRKALRAENMRKKGRRRGTEEDEDEDEAVGRRERRGNGSASLLVLTTRYTTATTVPAVCRCQVCAIWAGSFFVKALDREGYACEIIIPPI